MLWKGPQARVLLVMPSKPSRPAKLRLRWCSPALLAEYAYVSCAGTARPSTDPSWSAHTRSWLAVWSLGGVDICAREGEGAEREDVR